MRLPTEEFEKRSALAYASYAIARALNIVRFIGVGRAGSGVDHETQWLLIRLHDARKAGYTGKVAP